MNRIGRLTYKMLTDGKHARLKAKAAESRHLLDLLPVLMTEYRALFGAKGRHLEAAIRCMVGFFRIVKLEPRQMSAHGLNSLQENLLGFLASWKAFGGHMVYKHHACVHLCQAAERLGNPRFYWTYADEEENRKMSLVSRQLHKGRTFYITLLQRVLPEVL